MPPHCRTTACTTVATPSAVERSAGDIDHAVDRLRGHGARGGHHLCAGVVQALHQGRTHAFGSASDERAQALDLKIETHAVISRAAIRPRSSRKR